MKQFAIKFTKTEFEIMKSYEPIPPLRGRSEKIGIPLHTRIMGLIESEKTWETDFLNYEVEIIIREK